jgi:hypothetical protein
MFQEGGGRSRYFGHRTARESNFAQVMWQDIISVGLLMGGVTLVTQACA